MPITNAYANSTTANPDYYSVGDWKTAGTISSTMTYQVAAPYPEEQMRIERQRYEKVRKNARQVEKAMKIAKEKAGPVKPPSALDWLRAQVAETCASAQLTPA